MSSPASAPVLALLRSLIEKRGLNTAALAAKCNLSRARLRRVLTGGEPMTLDELLAVTQALELSPAELGITGAAEAPPAAEDPGPTLAAPVAPPEPEGPAVNPWGNHPEQLFRVGFALGCDLLFLAEARQLADSGLPVAVLEQYADGHVPIKLDAAYHAYNAPRYDAHGVVLTLSFDALYDCRFPWSAIRQIVFFPAPVDVIERDEGPRERPKLRLVE